MIQINSIGVDKITRQQNYEEEISSSTYERSHGCRSSGRMWKQYR